MISVRWGRKGSWYLCDDIDQLKSNLIPDIANRADLDQLIETFYGRVFADEQIGPFFTQIAPVVTPETHFPLLADFWETVLFGKNLYHHNIIQKHVELHRKQPLEPHHFERWLSLFTTTVDQLFSGPVAEQAKIRAQSMAMVLQVKIHTLTTAKP